MVGQGVPDQALEEIRRRVDLVDLISRAISLKKAGGASKGLCPFHTEKTPSFVVYPDHYHCYSCGAHGDAISWIQHRHGLDFQDAVAELASQIGVTIDTSSEPRRRTKVTTPVLVARQSKAPAANDVPPYRSALRVPTDAPSLLAAERPAGFGALKARGARTVHILNPTDAAKPRQSLSVAALYAYRDLDGALIGYVVRSEWTEASGKRRKITPMVIWAEEARLATGEVAKGWCYGVLPERLPYRVEHVRRCPTATRVWFEGEKAADAGAHLLGEGYLALAWAGGTGAVEKFQLPAEVVEGDHILCPDADAQGVKAMSVLAQRLRDAGCTGSIRICPAPPDSPKGWDLADATGWDGAAVADWLATATDWSADPVPVAVDNTPCIIPTTVPAALLPTLPHGCSYERDSAGLVPPEEGLDIDAARARVAKGIKDVLAWALARKPSDPIISTLMRVTTGVGKNEALWTEVVRLLTQHLDEMTLFVERESKDGSIERIPAVIGAYFPSSDLRFQEVHRIWEKLPDTHRRHVAFTLSRIAFVRDDQGRIVMGRERDEQGNQLPLRTCARWQTADVLLKNSRGYLMSSMCQSADGNRQCEHFAECPYIRHTESLKAGVEDGTIKVLLGSHPLLQTGNNGGIRTALAVIDESVLGKLTKSTSVYLADLVREADPERAADLAPPDLADHARDWAVSRNWLAKHFVAATSTARTGHHFIVRDWLHQQAPAIAREARRLLPYADSHGHGDLQLVKKMLARAADVADAFSSRLRVDLTAVDHVELASAIDGLDKEPWWAERALWLALLKELDHPQGTRQVTLCQARTSENQPYRFIRLDRQVDLHHSFVNTPVLNLDATGDSRLLKAVLPHHCWQTLTVTARQNARMVLLPEKSVADAELVAAIEARIAGQADPVDQRRGFERLDGTPRKGLLDKVLDEMRSMAARHDKLAVVSTKKIEQAFARLVEAFPEILPPAFFPLGERGGAVSKNGHSPLSGHLLWGHFGNLRGMNHMASCSGLYVLGRQQPPATAIEQMAFALGGDAERQADQPTWLDPEGDGSGDFAQHQGRFFVRGRGWIRRAHCVAVDDDLPLALLWQSREAEVIQAIGRLRAAGRADQVEIVVRSALPHLGIAWDDIQSHDQFMGVAVESRLERVLVATNGLAPLTPALAEALEVSNADRKALVAAGLDPAELARWRGDIQWDVPLTRRLGIGQVRWAGMRGRAAVLAFDADLVTDPTQALRAAGLDLTEFTLLATVSGAQAPITSRTKIDDIDSPTVLTTRLSLGWRPHNDNRPPYPVLPWLPQSAGATAVAVIMAPVVTPLVQQAQEQPVVPVVVHMDIPFLTEPPKPIPVPELREGENWFTFSVRRMQELQAAGVPYPQAARMTEQESAELHGR